MKPAKRMREMESRKERASENEVDTGGGLIEGASAARRDEGECP
jgi:hypothetical protein